MSLSGHVVIRYNRRFKVANYELALATVAVGPEESHGGSRDGGASTARLEATDSLNGWAGFMSYGPATQRLLFLAVPVLHGPEFSAERGPPLVLC